MFENIIEQGAVLQMQEDFLSRRLAPSMLFYGPPESGKGSAALETARILSCECDASWKCLCPACGQHRYLQHSDLLMLGHRPFTAEISACSSVFLHNPSSQSARALFIRSLRKLQIRFSAVLMEDDTKLGKLSPVLQSLEEALSEFWTASAAEAEQVKLEKLCGSLIKNANVLINEGLGNTIPVGHIRKAAYWCRLAPNGKRKTLIIENAENMRDEACNSLLKLLEEPPGNVSIILTSQRREVIIPTILSRLRPYRFMKRSAESEKEILRRVFQVSEKQVSEEQDTVNEESPASGSSLISAYLGSFLPGSTEKLYPLAAWFIVSLARLASVSFKKYGGTVPGVITALGERYAPIANEAGFERSVEITFIVKTLHEKSGNFEDDSFSRFLKICLDMISAVAREAQEPQFIAYNDIFKKYIGETETAVNILNQNTTIAMEALLYKLKKAMLKPKLSSSTGIGSAYG